MDFFNDFFPKVQTCSTGGTEMCSGAARSRRCEQGNAHQYLDFRGKGSTFGGQPKHRLPTPPHCLGSLGKVVSPAMHPRDTDSNAALVLLLGPSDKTLMTPVL